MINRIFTLNQKFYIRFPFIVTCIILPLISLYILNYAANFESSILGLNFSLSRVEKQFLWIILGFLTFFIIQFLRIRFLNEKIYSMYIITILMLLLPFLDDAVKGAQNWFFGFQPSEFGKIIIVIAFSKFLTDNQKHINNPFIILISSIIILIPALIFLYQKDIGTSLVYLSIFIPMLYWAGLKPAYCFLIFSPIGSGYVKMSFLVHESFNKDITTPIITLVIWLSLNVVFLSKIYKQKLNMVVITVSIILINILTSVASDISWNYLESKDSRTFTYVKKRIENFIVPSLNPQDGGYQVAQSKIAVGSGGMFGNGVSESTQVELDYLPEADTDFIVASIGEALGFIIIFLIILIYMNLFYWLLDYAYRTRNIFNSLIIIGFSSMLFFNCIISLGMVVAIAPVTGLPAPLLSYGGTFTLSTFIMIGICNNISNNN